MSIIVKSVINGIITFLVVGLALSLIKGIAFVQVITMPYFLFIVSSVIVGSYIGFTKNEEKQAKEAKQE